MLPLTRICLAITLTLAIVLAGQSSAQMRAMSDPAGQIVLCTGGGPVTVYVDDEGQPTRPPHHCPDCVMNLMVALVGPDRPDLDLPASDRAPAAEPAGAVIAQATLRATARGPPASL